MRRDFLYTSDLVPRSSPQPFHQVREPQEILDAPVSAPRADVHEGLVFSLVGPLCWHGEEPSFVIAAVQPSLAPAPASIERLEVAITQRMERMGNPKPLVQPAHIRCGW